MTTIGTATLQIIPSLLGVSEAIEKQLPSQPVEVKVQPKVDQPAAQKAGKEVGEAVTKSVNDAVKKGDIGKTVGDEIKSSTKKSSPGKEAAQIFIDGLVKGIGQGLRERFGANGIGGQVADSLKSGDIEGAAGHITGTISGIGDTVKTVTDKIADIGSTFGLQLDGVRDFGVKSDGVLGGVTNDVQGVVDKTMEVKGKFGEVGDFLETVLPGKAGKGAAAMVAALEGPAALLAALNIGVSKLPKDMQSIAASTIPGVSPTFKDQGPDAPWYKRDATMDIFRWLKDRSGHSVGGAVAGPGGTDNVLSWLTAGEGVITKDAMTRGGAPLMAALNAGWSPSPDLLKALLPGFSDGGMVGPDVEAALKLVGVPYSQAKRNDCSGTVAQIINAALGMTGSGLMSTKNAESWLTARGFKAGSGGPGTIRVGWYDHGPNPNDGHMAMTLSDGRNAESGGSVGPFTIGGSVGANSAQFDHVMYLPTAYGEGPPTAGSAKPAAAAAPASASPAPAASSSTASSSFSLPSSISGLSTIGLAGLGPKTKVTPDSPERTFEIGNAASAAISGQVQSALDVFGVDDSPGWLQGISKFVSGISVKKKDASSTPLAASSSYVSAASDIGSVHAGTGAAPGPGVVYNIAARDTEDAFIRAQRQERERSAAKLSVY